MSAPNTSICLWLKTNINFIDKTNQMEKFAVQINSTYSIFYTFGKH